MSSAPPCGIAYEGEPAAPDRAQQRLGDANGRGRRDRRVGRVPAGAVYLRRGLGRVRSPRGGGEGRLCCPGNVHRRLSYAFEAPARRASSADKDGSGHKASWSGFVASPAQE